MNNIKNIDPSKIKSFPKHIMDRAKEMMKNQD